MNIQQKIEKWLRNAQFTDYSNRRILAEVDDVCDNHRPDPEYEELIRAFGRDERYIVPMVAYLNYRLQVAKLQKNARRRKRAVWWVFVQSVLLSNATQIHFVKFSLLQTELMETVMPILHEEYMQKLNKKNAKIWSSNT